MSKKSFIICAVAIILVVVISLVGNIITIADKASQIAALGIASTRSMEAAADKVFALLASEDAEISAAAYKALVGVVEPKDFNRLSALIEKDGGKHTAEIQAALKNALVSLPVDKQFATVMPCVNKSANVSLYYPVLAQVGSAEAIAEIMKGYNGNYKKEAFAALLAVNNVDMIEILYNIAVNDKDNAQAALARYTNMVNFICRRDGIGRRSGLKSQYV